MRLIKADHVIALINEEIRWLKIKKEQTEKEYRGGFDLRIAEAVHLKECIEALPTAYDVDAVVEQMKQQAEQYNNGWIPCSERLPEGDRKRYIVQKTNGFIDILGFTKDAYMLSKYDFAEYKGKKKPIFYDYDSEYGYIEWECEAWQPLPPDYKEGGV